MMPNEETVPQRKSTKALILMNIKNIQYYEQLFSSTLQIIQSRKAQQGEHVVFKSGTYKNETSFTYREDFLINYIFEQTQLLTFKLFINNNLYGFVKNISLVSIIKSRKNQLKFVNENQEQVGTLQLSPQILSIKDEKKTIKLSVRSKLEGKIDRSSEYFYKIVREEKKKNETKQVEVYISDTMTPNSSSAIQWPQIQVLGIKLCLNQLDTKLTLKLYIKGFFWIHTQVGSCDFTVNQIKKQLKIHLMMEKKITGFAFIKGQIKQDKNYLEHIADGLDIMSILCIDFTESNLAYTYPKSKHYFSSDKLSDYEQVLETSIEQIMQYDNDKQIPTFGFGSIVNHPNFFTNGKVSHRFPLSMDPNKVNFSSLEEIRKAYRENIKYLKFAGPTYMAFLMRWAVQECKQILSSEDNYKYMILFILTDGQFCDDEEMRDLIVECSHLPISTVFIGIGDEDFTLLEELDDDDAKLVDSNGNPTVRDSVQFVPFEKYKNNLLAFKKEVLAEIPRQIEEYFILNKKQKLKSENKIEYSTL